MALLNQRERAKENYYNSTVSCIYIVVRKIQSPNKDIKHLHLRLLSPKTVLEKCLPYENAGIHLWQSPIRWTCFYKPGRDLSGRSSYSSASPLPSTFSPDWFFILRSEVKLLTPHLPGKVFSLPHKRFLPVGSRRISPSPGEQRPRLCLRGSGMESPHQRKLLPLGLDSDTIVRPLHGPASASRLPSSRLAREKILSGTQLKIN